MKVKKLLAAIFVCTIAVCALSVPAFADDVWDGSVDTTWYVEGSSEYTFTTAEQLAGLAQLVYEGNEFRDVAFYLGDNIDLNNQEWLPIGAKDDADTTHTFYGSFDGDGHTISNLKITVVDNNGALEFGNGTPTHSDNKIGLFGYTGADITNFTVNNVDVDGTVLGGSGENGASGGATAAVIGCPKNSQSTVSDIHVTGDINVKGNHYVGVIMGRHEFTSFRDCSVEGNIYLTGNSYVGVIAAGGTANAGSRNVTFENCTVSGHAEISGSYCVGAIAGAVESSGADSTTTATNCVVDLDESSYLKCSGKYYAGGIFGKTGWGSGAATLTNCSSNIDIEADLNAGGMIGYCSSSVDIDNCSYTGNIAGEDSGAVLGKIQYVRYNYDVTDYTFTGTVNGMSATEDIWTPACTDTSGAFTFEAAVVNADGKYTLYTSESEAQAAATESGGSLVIFGLMSFDDFKAALDNASVSGGTVELTGDVTLEESITIPENVAINAGDYNIILPIPTSTDSQLTTVTTVSGDDSLNKVLKSNQVNIGDNPRELLVAYTDDGNSRVYSLSAIVGNNEGGNGIYNIYMGGRDTVIEERTDSELDTDLKLIYTESGVEYTALYNTAQHTNGNNLPARIFGGWEVPSEIPEPYATMLGINNRENISEYKLTLKSGVIESLRGASKEKEGSKAPKVTLNVEGGSADILATGWYYLESVAEYEVNVSGGEVGAIYGNGQTSYTASDNMKDPNFVPTVDNATINISGGDIGFIYGGGRALTQSENSSDKSMVNNSVTINITGGVIDWVNGGGFSGPEAHWGNTSGQDKTIVNDAVINISGGDIYRVFNGGYNGQWNYTYKINADGDLVFSNYNGTDESQTVRNIVNNSTINVSEGADIEELYMGGRSYAYTQNAVVNMTGGRVGNFATSGSYGYTENADANISGGTIDTLELVHRNYVGNIDLDATGGNVANFYAGTGGAYKNSNLVEQAYNLSTIAILGNVDINFENGALTGGSYLTTGLEQADAVTSNVPLTVTYMNLKEDSGYTGSLDYCGQFVVVKDNADWNAIVILTDKDHTSFTTTDEDFACASGVEGMIAVKDEDGAYKLQPASTESSQAAKIGEAYYPTLQAAYNSAIDGSVIELLRNCGEDDAITVAKELTIDLNEYSASISVDDNYIRRTSEDGLFVVVAKNSVADAINVTFEKASEDDDTLYNIVLVASEEKTINRLSTADLTFDLQATAIDYEIIPVAGVNTVNESEDRYLFYFNTNPDPDATGEAITIAQVKFTGYGKLEFGIDEDVDTNAAHAATLADSIVTDYIVDGSDLEDETVGDLNINENVTVGKGVIETTINVPKKTLAVNIDFNNSITDNASAYQDMKATISGGDLTTPIVKTFGSEGGDIIALSGNSYSFTEDLTENTAYTVTIEGAGYRTTRYTVTMTCDKTLNFWNNVKDTATVVEVGNNNSMATVNYLAGDIVMNNVIDIYDLSAVVAYFGEVDMNAEGDNYNPGYAKYDLNRDGKIDSKDVAMVLVSWGK